MKSEQLLTVSKSKQTSPTSRFFWGE